jgi:hypothetical protein
MTDNFACEVANAGQLLALLGNHVNLKAALCITCQSKAVNLACKSNTKFKWAFDIGCMNCLTSWSICIHCTNYRSKMTKLFMMNKHDKLYHLIQNDVCHVPAVAPCDTEVVLEDNLNLITYGNCISNTFFDHCDYS